MKNNSLLRTPRLFAGAGVASVVTMAFGLFIALDPALAEFEIQEAGIEVGGLPIGDDAPPRGNLEEMTESLSDPTNECFAESEECKQAVHALLLEVMPYSVAVFTPPGWDLDYTRCYGFELEDIFAFGLRSVRTKWRATGR